MTARRSWWWGFALYLVVSAVHVVLLAVDSPATYPTKLLLMPVLVLAVAWALLPRWNLTATLLVAALLLSWLGDGAAFFFPFLDNELPAMLACFGLAHLVYIWLFQTRLARRPLPWWSLVYALWWGVLLAVLWSHVGALLIAVALYGLVLAGTAASSTRGIRALAWGGALFLISDSILAFRLFLPDAIPPFTSPLVMVFYCAGQGLIAAAAVRTAPREEVRATMRT